MRNDFCSNYLMHWGIQKGGKKPNAMIAGFVSDAEYPLAFVVAVEDAGYGRDVCVPILSKVLAACKTVLDS